MLQSMPEAFRVLADDTRRELLFRLGELRQARIDDLAGCMTCEDAELQDQLRHLEEWELVDVDRSVDPWNCIIDSSVTVDETATDIVLTLRVAKGQQLQLSLRKDAGTI